MEMTTLRIANGGIDDAGSERTSTITINSGPLGNGRKLEYGVMAGYNTVWNDFVFGVEASYTNKNLESSTIHGNFQTTARLVDQLNLRARAGYQVLNP